MAILGDPACHVATDRSLQAGDVPSNRRTAVTARLRNQQIDDDVVRADFELGVVAAIAVWIEKHFDHFLFPQPRVTILQPAPTGRDRLEAKAT